MMELRLWGWSMIACSLFGIPQSDSVRCLVSFDAKFSIEPPTPFPYLRFLFHSAPQQRA